jgi:HlyD family secretion protein
MMTSAMLHIRDAINNQLRFGSAIIVATIGGVGGWAAVTEIAGAVIAPGQVVVESNVKKVQHPSGGIVGALNVRDGQVVKAGDVLIRLDETIARAGFVIVSKTLDDLTGRKARLIAEHDSALSINFPDELRARALDPAVSGVLNGETKLFEMRRTVRNGQIEQLRQRIAQLFEEITGATSQAAAKAQEIVLINRELAGARELWGKKLMPISKLTALEREATRVAGEHGALLASIARVKGKVTETELQIVQIDSDQASDVAKQLSEVETKLGEFNERKVAAEDLLKRIDIRAPQGGKVHELAFHTIGGVVKPGETLMLIVPEADNMTVDARVTPHEIDQLKLGQIARLRFTAFNQRTTPEISGTLDRISADVSTDPRSGSAFYTLRIAISAAELARLGGLKLIPGMPVETFVETANRRVLSYLVRPLHDQMTRALREK